MILHYMLFSTGMLHIETTESSQAMYLQVAFFPRPTESDDEIGVLQYTLCYPCLSAHSPLLIHSVAPSPLTEHPTDTRFKSNAQTQLLISTEPF